MALGATLVRLKNWLLPPACVLCDLPTDGARLCAGCFSRLRAWPASCCLRCGRPLPDWLAPGPCGRCLAHPPRWQQAVHLFVYRGAVREMVLAWKLGGRIAPLSALIELAAPRLNELLASTDLLVPVPSSTSSIRRYGMHPAATLARLIARCTGCRWHGHVLARRGNDPRQSSLPAHACKKNLARAFVLKRMPETEGRIWLVDDIYTTGTTAKRAFAVLSRHPKAFGVLTLSRVPSGR